MQEDPEHGHWTPLHHNGIWEPFQLRELKKKLANVKCCCAVCHSSCFAKHPVQDPKKYLEVTDKCPIRYPKKYLEVTEEYLASLEGKNQDVDVIREQHIRDPKKYVEATEKHHVEKRNKAVEYAVGDPINDLEVTENENQFNRVQWIDIPHAVAHATSKYVDPMVDIQSLESRTDGQLIDISEIQSKNLAVLEDRDDHSKPAAVLVSNETITDDFSFPWHPFFQKGQNYLCPGCNFTIDLLRHNTRKVLLDVGIETKPQIYTCNKSTSKNILTMEKSTSYNKPVLKYPLTSVSDDFSNIENIASIRREVTFACNNNHYNVHEYAHKPGNLVNSSSESLQPVNIAQISDDEHLEEVEEEETSTTVLEASSEINFLQPAENNNCDLWVEDDIRNFLDSITPPHNIYFSSRNCYNGSN